MTEPTVDEILNHFEKVEPATGMAAVLAKEVRRLRAQLPLDTPDPLDCPACGGSGHIDDAKLHKARLNTRAIWNVLAKYTRPGDPARKQYQDMRRQFIALTRTLTDNPDFDGTDLSHPSWWRGHDATVDTMCAMINRILDGSEPSGGIAREPWQSLQARLRELVAATKDDSEMLTVAYMMGAHDAKRVEVPRWLLEMIKEHPAGSCHTIQHDGFHGHVIGYYQRHDGKRGVVMQFGGTNVVHVYGEKWLA